MQRKFFAWLPAVVAPAVIAVGVIAVPMQAGAAVDLPDKTADDVLVLIAESTADSFSGTVEKTAALGLPSLPGGMDDLDHGAGDAGSVSSMLDLLGGTQQARVFADGPMNLRVQVKDSLAESNAITNATDAWFYDSETNVATHVAIPADAGSAIHEKFDAPDSVATPAQLADRILENLGPSTDFSVGTDARVAGRTVYELVLTPRVTGTLAESVSISVDSETGLPLQVSILASGQEEPAFEVGFTAIDFTTPSADLFTFTPGDGVIVEEKPFPSTPEAGTHDARTPGSEPVVTGSGWDAIVEMPAASVPTDLAGDPLFSQLTTEVDGGRVFSTALVTVLITDDGRILAGSVPVDRLLAAADAD